MQDDDRTRRGRQLRRKVLGAEYVDTAESAQTALNQALQDLITRYAWGDVWSRPGLDLKTRSLVTLGMLIARNGSEDLFLHIRGALRNGASPQEIVEVTLHSAIYCGLPAARAAARIADGALHAMDGAALPPP